MATGKRDYFKIALDVSIIFAVGLPIIAFYVHLSPFKRGFFCDDDSIRYPYKYSTISDVVMYSVGVCVPVSIIALTEIINSVAYPRSPKNTTLFHGIPIFVAMRRMYKVIAVFLFGACIIELTTDIAKYIIGRLRPHFLDVCKPNIDCATMDPHEYIHNYECTGDDLYKIIDARQSFPSGHSSFATFTLIFTIIYLQKRMNYSGSQLLRPFIQFVLFLVCICTCLSRISDYKHHWSDVMVGGIFGTSMACVVAVYTSDLFSKDTAEPSNVFRLNPHGSSIFQSESDVEKNKYELRETNKRI